MHNIEIGGLDLHGPGCSLHVHEYNRYPVPGHQLGHTIVCQGRNIIDHAGPGLQSRLCHLRIIGVNTNGDIRMRGQGLNH